MSEDGEDSGTSGSAGPLIRIELAARAYIF